MVFLVGQRLARRNDNRLTSVNAERIHVLHITDCNAIVMGITDHFVLDFFIVVQVLLDQNLWRKGQSTTDDMLQFLLITSNA